MKKIFMVQLGVLLMVSAVAVPIFAASALTASEAKTIAEKTVPAKSAHIRTEDDKSWYEVNFYNKAKQEWYEVDIDKTTRKAVSFDSDAADQTGSKTVTLTEAQAKKAVTNEIKGGEILGTVLEKDDGYNEYKVSFKTDAYYGEYKIHPESGKILERDITVGKPPATVDATGLISYEKIVALAQAKMPGATVTDVDLDYKKSGTYYSIELSKDSLAYELMYDAKTGELLWDRSYQDNHNEHNGASATPAATTISLEKAKEIALAQAPGTTVRVCKLDYDDGRAVYEGELSGGGMEYEFEIDAVTGRILEWDQERDD